MTTLIQNLNRGARHVLCFAMSVLIVGAGLVLGEAGADAAFRSAQAAATVHFA